MHVKQEVIGVDSGDYESTLFWASKKENEVVSHDPVSLSRWLEDLPEHVVLATESPDSALVRGALHLGIPVVTTTPVRSYFARKIEAQSGKKDDAFDAKLHANMYLNFADCFVKVDKRSELVATLRYACNARDALIQDHIAQTNRLRALIKTSFPGLHAIRPNMRALWVLEFIAKSPTSDAFADFDDEKTLRKLATKAKLSVAKTRELLEANAHRPGAVFAEIETECVSDLARRCYEQLRTEKKMAVHIRNLLKELSRIEREDSSLTKDEPTVIDILLSFPQASWNTIGRIVAEYPAILTQPESKNLLAYSGVIPVTRESGSIRKVRMRRSRNVVLQNAFIQIACNVRNHDPKYKKMYDRFKGVDSENGKYRRISRSIIKTMCAMVNNRQVYMPQIP